MSKKLMFLLVLLVTFAFIFCNGNKPVFSQQWIAPDTVKVGDIFTVTPILQYEVTVEGFGFHMVIDTSILEYVPSLNKVYGLFSDESITPLNQDSTSERTIVALRNLSGETTIMPNQYLLTMGFKVKSYNGSPYINTHLENKEIDGNVVNEMNDLVIPSTQVFRLIYIIEQLE